jgi:hypothetical protein
MRRAECLRMMTRPSALLLALCLLPACGGTVANETSTDSGGDTIGTDSGGSDTGLILPDAPTDIGFDKSCTMAGMCALVPASCCGYCGMPTAIDQIAIPRDKASAYRTLACAGGAACPECAGTPDPNLQAFCRSGACVPVFVPTDEVSACTTDDDCQLVQGVCCGPCGGELTLTSVAKSKVGEFNSQICDPRVDCAGCPVPSPTKSIPRCDPATQHCTVIKAP